MNFDKILAVIASTTDLPKLRQILANASKLHGESHIVSREASARLAFLQKTAARATISRRITVSDDDTCPMSEVIKARNDLDRMTENNAHKPGHSDSLAKYKRIWDARFMGHGDVIRIAVFREAQQEIADLYKDADAEFQRTRSITAQHARAAIVTADNLRWNLVNHRMFVRGRARVDTATSPAVARARAKAGE
jgi:hypothetical protein